MINFNVIFTGKTNYQYIFVCPFGRHLKEREGITLERVYFFVESQKMLILGNSPLINNMEMS